MNRLSLRQKQNQPFTYQPRQSLKKTMTSKKKPQKNQARMSMLPLKRQRMSVVLQSKITSSRPSTSALQPNNNLLNTINFTTNQSFYNSSRKSISKQTIINNLVNKLDEKEELRSIIETKLKSTLFIDKKGNSYGANKEFVYTSDFQPYASNLSTHETKNFNSTLNLRKSEIQNYFHQTLTKNQEDSSILSKLQQCQQELAYFKSIVADLSKKINKLEKQPNNDFSTTKYDKKPKFYESQCLNYNSCVKCLNCKCSKDKKILKNVKDVETQTGSFQQNISNKQDKDLFESDFFDNLEKTLKILDKTKNL